MKSKNRVNYKLTNDYIAEKVRGTLKKSKKEIHQLIEYSTIEMFLESESNENLLNGFRDYYYGIVEDLMNGSIGATQQTSMRIQVKTNIISNIYGPGSQEYSEHVSGIIHSLVYINFYKDHRHHNLTTFLIDNCTINQELIMFLEKEIKHKIYQLPHISLPVIYTIFESNLYRISRNYTFFERLFQYSQGDISEKEIIDCLERMGNFDPDLDIKENLEDELDEIITETLYCTIIHKIISHELDKQKEEVIKLLNLKTGLGVISGTDFDDNGGYNTDGGQFIFDQFGQVVYEYNKRASTSLGEIFSKYHTNMN